MLRSLRNRLVVGVVGATALFLCVAAAALYAAVHQSLIGEFDAVLGSKARILSIMVVEGDDYYKLVFERSHFPEYEDGADAEYFVIYRPNGRILQRSPSLDRGELPLISGPLAAPATAVFTLPDGRPGRIAGVRFSPRREDGVQLDPSAERELTLVVAQSTEELDRRLARFRYLLIGVFAAATVVAGLVLAGVVAGFMRPLRDLATRLDALGANDLSARFSDVRWIEELRPIADRLDDMFVRLDQAFRREKAFTSDVAHELRTPLSGLRSVLEVTLRLPRGTAEYQDAMQRCFDQVARLQSLVDTLLSMARLEGGNMLISAEPLELNAVVHDVWVHYAAAAKDRRVEVELDLAGQVILEADLTQVRIIVANLCDNAVSYVSPDGCIQLQVALSDGWGIFRIANTVGDDDVDVERIFDRFARGDRSRTEGRHAGLGLSLSRRLAELSAGYLIAHREEGMFVMTLQLPLAELPSADDVA